jgi:mannose/cellobiose epimerase-like protein (N-acyl-D-glucosamine 2-epimerase family)
MSGEEAYLRTLEQHLAFIEQYVLDDEYGEWYPQLKADGTLAEGRRGPSDAKGSRSKSPYHVIQALYHAHHDLRRAAEAQAVREPRRWADYCL